MNQAVPFSYAVSALLSVMIVFGGGALAYGVGWMHGRDNERARRRQREAQKLGDESRAASFADVLSRITLTNKDTGETMDFLEAVKRGIITTEVIG